MAVRYWRLSWDTAMLSLESVRQSGCAFSLILNWYWGSAMSVAHPPESAKPFLFSQEVVVGYKVRYHTAKPETLL